MSTTKRILISAICMAGLCLWSCKTEENLYGVIHGTVTDDETTQPLANASIVVNNETDTLSTASDGTYLIEDLKAGEYEIQALKTGYMRKSINASVVPEKTVEVNFTLNEAINISDSYLDFGVESTTKYFTVSNTGKSAMKYTVVTNQSWIEINAASGELTDETDTVKVTIRKPDSSQNILKGEIVINSTVSEASQQDKLRILANGAMDRDSYYKVVKIGDHYWMAENTKAGNTVGGGVEQKDPAVIKKYCYNNDESYSNIYGGLYTWSGMMQGAEADNEITGTTRGVCPVGWHLPTLQEWVDMINYLSEPVSGLKLKEAGETHWQKGNVATNESGFTALPGGMWDGSYFGLLKSHAFFWTASSDDAGHYYALQFEYNAEKGFFKLYQEKEALSVRCVKNP
jgi:uncharacterized protein (TIGR02145 family)